MDHHLNKQRIEIDRGNYQYFIAFDGHVLFDNSASVKMIKIIIQSIIFFSKMSE